MKNSSRLKTPLASSWNNSSLSISQDAYEQTRKAVIYCRVSSRQQVTDGSGLESQETRCRDYARRKGYTVEAVFKEEGVSGSRADRPELLKIL